MWLKNYGLKHNTINESRVNMKIKSTTVDVFPFRILNNKLEFLILQMNPTTQNVPKDKPIWQVVHGSIESGETAIQAAVRELKEETGFKPIKVYQLDDIHTQYVARKNNIELTVVFAVQLNKDQSPKLSNEHVNYKWVKLLDGKKYLRFLSHRRALTEIDKGFRIYNFQNLWAIR